jgi:hypothetical protein
MLYLLLRVAVLKRKVTLILFLRLVYVRTGNKFWLSVATIWLSQATKCYFDVVPLGQNILMKPKNRNFYVLLRYRGSTCLHISFGSESKVWRIGPSDLVKNECSIPEQSNCLLSTRLLKNSIKYLLISSNPFGMIISFNQFSWRYRDWSWGKLEKFARWRKFGWSSGLRALASANVIRPPKDRVIFVYVLAEDKFRNTRYAYQWAHGWLVCTQRYELMKTWMDTSWAY